MSAPTYLVAALELGMLFAGLVLLWRLVFSPTARIQRGTSPLPPWEAPITNFLRFLLYIFLGTMLVATIGSLVSRRFLEGDPATLFNGAAAQFGMLAAIAAYHFGVERLRFDVPPPRVGILTSGVATFLISLPLLAVTSLAWQAFLELWGITAQRQDLIRMFANADSAGLLLTMTALAVIIAPVAEELVFRAGLFRYFRTRMPRSAALVMPALFFSVLHTDWRTLEGFVSFAPLTVLAIVYSISYERTGRIGTAIVAHALFNLNTVAMIMVGLGV